MDLKLLKKIYDLIDNDYLRGLALTLARTIGIKKDIVRIDTNNFCNIRCIMCTSTLGEKGHIMSLNDYKKIIDKVKKDVRFLYLSCGYEPLATPNFKDYMEYAKESGVTFISFCTNALLLDEDIIHSLVDNQINEVIISFNGFTKGDYERIMKNSNYDRVISNINRLNEYKKEKGSVYPKIRVNSLLMKSNLMNLDKIVDFIRTYNIGKVQFRDMRINELQNDVKESEKEMVTNVSSHELKEIVNKLIKECEFLKERGTEIILPKKLLNMDIDVKKTFNSDKKGCTIPFFSYWIESDGKIKACLYDEKAELGNILTDADDLMRGKLNVFRRTAMKGKCNKSKCTANMDSSTII